jgi:hypothetical protein
LKESLTTKIVGTYEFINSAHHQCLELQIVVLENDRTFSPKFFNIKVIVGQIQQQCQCRILPFVVQNVRQKLKLMENDVARFVEQKFNVNVDDVLIRPLGHALRNFA